MTEQKKPPPTQRDNKPKQHVPTRDSEQRERPEERQYHKRKDHPLNEDPDIPAEPRREARMRGRVTAMFSPSRAG
jgi:hypothetical protein